MKRRFITGMTIAASLTAGAPAASASAGPAATEIAVKVQAADLTGVRPDGTTVEFQVQASASGSDASSIQGAGHQVGSGGARSNWPASGSVDGNTITLAGVVDGSNATFLAGSPVKLDAVRSTGAMTLTFGPLAGGPFAGKTIVAQGVGTVTITIGNA